MQRLSAPRLQSAEVFLDIDLSYLLYGGQGKLLENPTVPVHDACLTKRFESASRLDTWW